MQTGVPGEADIDIKVTAKRMRAAETWLEFEEEVHVDGIANATIPWTLDAGKVRFEGSVSVPGVTRAWSMLLERFGTRPLGHLLEPAVHCARDGFPISDIVCQAIRERAPGNADPEWHRAFVPQGAFPTVGQCFRQR